MNFMQTAHPTRRLITKAMAVGVALSLSACASLQESTQEFISPKPACKNSLEANLQSVSLQPIFDSMASAGFPPSRPCWEFPVAGFMSRRGRACIQTA